MATARARAGVTRDVFADITSVMDFRIILGALLASGLAGSQNLAGKCRRARCSLPGPAD